MKLPKSKLTKKQTKKFKVHNVKQYGQRVDIIAEVRYDDKCGNGHNSFAITADIYKAGRRDDRSMIACGCCHDEIARHFPQLAPLLKWHFMSSDGPMHYISNSMYHASDKDYNGLRKGEPNHRHDATVIKFGNFPITYRAYRHYKFVDWLKQMGNYDNLRVVGIAHHEDKNTFGTKYTFDGYTDKWHECPFDTELEALQLLDALQNHNPQFIKVVTSWGEGKEPDLQAARNSAVWPDAELSDFTEEKLKARLPALMEEFKRDVESLGFIY